MDHLFCVSVRLYDPKRFFLLLIFHLFSLILLSWAINWEYNLSFALSVNVTSLFKTNNLISLLPTVLYILQTALLPIYSKLSDMYGRAQCYTVALTFYIVSYIIMATANNYETLVVSWKCGFNLDGDLT